MYNCFKELSTDIVFNVLYICICIYIYICHESGWIGGKGPPAGSGKNQFAEQPIESHTYFYS